MIENVIIRKADKFDIEKLEELQPNLFETQLNLNSIFQKLGTVKLVPQISIIERLNDPSCCFFIVEYENKAIGYSNVKLAERDILFEAKDYALLVDLFIDKKTYKNLNFFSIAFQLFSLCENWAKDHNRRFLCADVYGDNLRVIKMITRAGFSEYRIRFVKDLMHK